MNMDSRNCCVICYVNILQYTVPIDVMLSSPTLPVWLRSHVTAESNDVNEVLYNTHTALSR